MMSERLEPDWAYYDDYTFEVEGTFKATITVSAKTREEAKELLENCRSQKEWDGFDYDIEDLYIETIYEEE